LVAELQQPAYSEVLKKSGLSGAGLAGFGGTAYGFTDAWFAGFDRNVTCVVWLGYDETRTIGKDAWAKDIAFPLWAAIMAEATQGSPEGWPVSPGQTRDLICVRSGAQAGPACLTAGDTLSMPRFSGMKEVVAPACLYHQRSDAEFGAPAGVAEVFPAPHPSKSRVTATVRARTVTPASPSVVGVDVYGAISSDPDSRQKPEH
jgi:membrane peptidoglycan carboxypeptidase